jgi:hypothetical protein
MKQLLGHTTAAVTMTVLHGSCCADVRREENCLGGLVSIDDAISRRGEIVWGCRTNDRGEIPD